MKSARLRRLSLPSKKTRTFRNEDAVLGKPKKKKRSATTRSRTAI